MKEQFKSFEDWVPSGLVDLLEAENRRKIMIVKIVCRDGRITKDQV